MTEFTKNGPTGKKILCLDFDGVCHLYTSGWKGASTIPDQPVYGMWEALRSYQTIFEVDIFSSRSNQDGGIRAMQDWFYEHMPDGNYLPVYHALIFPTEKPPAFVGLDDRVITFRGEWPEVEELESFKTWTQNPLGAMNRHPRGKVNQDDEGELKLAVYHKDGTVFIDFGKTTAWIGFDASTAKAFADLINSHAQAIEATT
jgi:hypothetical protein